MSSEFPFTAIATKDSPAPEGSTNVLSLKKGVKVTITGEGNEYYYKGRYELPSCEEQYVLKEAVKRIEAQQEEEPVGGRMSNGDFEEDFESVSQAESFGSGGGGGGGRNSLGSLRNQGMDRELASLLRKHTLDPEKWVPIFDAEEIYNVDELHDYLKHEKEPFAKYKIKPMQQKKIAKLLNSTYETNKLLQLIDAAELESERWRKTLANHGIKTQKNLIDASDKIGKDIAEMEARDAGERRKIRMLFSVGDRLKEGQPRIPCLRGCGIMVPVAKIEDHVCFDFYNKTMKDLVKRVKDLEAHTRIRESREGFQPRRDMFEDA